MKAKLLIAVVALQAAWVVVTAVQQEIVLSRGTIVLLDTAPVDPRDLLRGDYVILSYRISTLPETLFAGGIPNDVATGTAVFVRLEKREQFHEAESASFSPMEPESGRPVIRGTVTSSWGGRRENSTEGIVRVAYGLERYYVREGTGDPRGRLTVEAAVAPSGDAAIRQVYIDGRPYAEVMRGR